MAEKITNEAMIPSEEVAKRTNKYPLAVLVSIATALMTTFINKQFDTAQDNRDDLKEQIVYLQKQVRDLQIKDSTRTAENDKLLRAFVIKETQIKAQARIIDSLKTGG